MKKVLYILRLTCLILGVLIVLYAVGPTPALPTFAEKLPVIQGAPTEIAQRLASQESQIKALKPHNQARIIWADSTQKIPTDIVIVYLHGFFASSGEGMPVLGQLAEHYRANVVCNRMPGHGIADRDAMLQATPESMWASAQEALVIGQKLGKRIIVVGTSTGGSLALLLASKYPELITALVLYSPLIDFYTPAIWLFYKPWGLHIARLVNGSAYNKETYSPKARLYWTSEYRLEAVVALCNLIANTMHQSTFKKVKVPVFVGAYYKDEIHQDHVVSVAAIKRMFGQLGTSAGKKKMVLFPASGHHVITSDLRASQVGKVAKETISYLADIL